MHDKNVTIIILASGKSSRLWPLTHKALIKFGQYTALEHQIKCAQEHASQIIVTANDDNKTAIESITSGYNNAHVVLQTGEGMAAGVLAAKSLVDGQLIIINVADFFEQDILASVLSQANTSGADCVLAAKQMTDYFPGGYFALEGEKVTGIIEKPDPDKTPSSYVKLVADYFRNGRNFIDRLEHVQSEEDDHYEAALTDYIQSDTHVTFVEYEGAWQTIKYPWDGLSVGAHFLKSIKAYRGKNVTIHETAIIEGNVYIDDNVTIHAYAKIQGPSYIGRNTIVGNFALIVESMVGNGCIVGGYAEVTRSLLQDRVFLHRNYVGDSIMADDVLMGAGAVLANFRFDQKTIKSTVKGVLTDTKRQKLGAIVGSQARIGVNASTMPGIKIESRAVIKPGSVATRDVTNA